MPGRALFTTYLWAGTGLALAFLLLPIVAIFLELSAQGLWSGVTSAAAVDALRVTLVSNVVANALILAVGTPAAYLVANRRFRGREVLLTLIELPLVLPPAVAGLGLIATFGRLGLLGGTLDALGASIALTQVAVVIAVTFVAGPFYVRSAVAAFAAVDPTLPEAARTLGAGPGRTFWRIAVPAAAGGLGAGAALAFARGIGEFGATIMFAGSLQGVTQTLSLAVYEQFDVDFETALAIGAELVVFSAAVLLLAKVMIRWKSSPSTSGIVFARSTST